MTPKRKRTAPPSESPPILNMEKTRSQFLVRSGCRGPGSTKAFQWDDNDAASKRARLGDAVSYFNEVALAGGHAELNFDEVCKAKLK